MIKMDKLNKKFILLLFLLVSSIFSERLNDLTTYDERFEDHFQVEHIRDGDGIHFPEFYKYVRMKFKGFVPATGQVFDSTDSRGGIYEFQYRKHFTNIKTSIVHPSCWNHAFPKMSTGEKIVIICPSDMAFGNLGLVIGSKVVIKSGETVAYELEMLNAQYDPYRFKLIKKGINDVKPRYMDNYRYKYTMWVGEDREFPVVTFDSGMVHLNGISFDSGENECITEAVRYLSVGGIAEVQCPNRYTRGSSYYAKYQVPDDSDLGFRIQLVSLKQSYYYKYSDEK